MGSPTLMDPHPLTITYLPRLPFGIENFVQKLFILILHDLDRGLCFAKLFCFENPASEVASLAQHRMTETCFLLRCVTRPV